MTHNSNAKAYRSHLSTAQDARAVRTREALRCALLGLLEVKPLDQITVRDIAAAADVGYATFFRYQPTKEALLNDIAAEEIKRLMDLAFPVLLEATNPRAASIALCTYVDQHRALWSTLLKNGGAAGAMREEFIRIARGIAPAKARADQWLPAEIGVTMAISGTIELLASWLGQKKPLTIEQVAEIHDRLIVTPMINADETGAWRVVRPKKKRG